MNTAEPDADIQEVLAQDRPRRRWVMIVAVIVFVLLMGVVLFPLAGSSAFSWR